jgi:hypothetical protein
LVQDLERFDDGARTERGRLLVVDDEPDFARFVKASPPLNIDMAGLVTLEDGKRATVCALNQCEFSEHLILMSRMDTPGACHRLFSIMMSFLIAWDDL